MIHHSLICRDVEREKARDYSQNEWFEFLKSKKLRTYFNDHPFPVANQTTPKEVAFRYKGLSEWIGRGLSYWWLYVEDDRPSPSYCVRSLTMHHCVARTRQ